MCGCLCARVGACINNHSHLRPVLPPHFRPNCPPTRSELSSIADKASVRRLQRTWDASKRQQQFAEDLALRQVCGYSKLVATLHVE